MPVTKAEAHRALELLEDYYTRYLIHKELEPEKMVEYVIFLKKKVHL